jgi:hypothetical protein
LIGWLIRQVLVNNDGKKLPFGDSDKHQFKQGRVLAMMGLGPLASLTAHHLGESGAKHKLP